MAQFREIVVRFSVPVSIDEDGAIREWVDHLVVLTNDHTPYAAQMQMVEEMTISLEE